MGRGRVSRTLVLQAQRGRTHIPLLDLSLQHRNDLDGHVQDSELGVGLGVVIRAGHGDPELLGGDVLADVSQLVQGQVDVLDSHPLPGVVGEPALLVLLVFFCRVDWIRLFLPAAPSAATPSCATAPSPGRTADGTVPLHGAATKIVTCNEKNHTFLNLIPIKVTERKSIDSQAF